MNKVEAFKNELRNYKYYKSVLFNYENAYNDEELDILEQFNSKLKDCDLKLDEIWVEMTGVHAIRYDKVPSSTNEELSMERKLDLIEKYNELLSLQKKEKKIAKDKLKNEIARIKQNIKKIENVLNSMPKEIACYCVKVYCDKYTYQQLVMSGTVYWTDAGLFKAIERELDKLL